MVEVVAPGTQSMKTPDPLATMARTKAAHLKKASIRVNYEVRICSSCDHETKPRPSRPRPWGEVPCICGGREFVTVPLERQPKMSLSTRAGVRA